MHYYNFKTKEKPQLNPNKFYVYAHCTSEGDLTPDYVGVGNARRVFDTGRRSTEWTDTFQKEGGFWVYIILETNSRTEAGCVEEKVISKRKPRLNKYHNPNYQQSKEVRKLRSQKAKEQWRSQEAHPNSIEAGIENFLIAREERSLAVVRSDGKQFNSICEAARAIPCSPATIKSRIESGTSWKGYTFNYL